MSATERLRFSRRMRVTSHAEFQRVMSHGVRGGDRWLQVRALTNELGHPRLGVIVGKRHGNAVVRNRLKRLLREAFRLSQKSLPAGVDLACAPRAGEVLTLQRTMKSMVDIATRLARRLGDPGG